LLVRYGLFVTKVIVVLSGKIRQWFLASNRSYLNLYYYLWRV